MAVNLTHISRKGANVAQFYRKTCGAISPLATITFVQTPARRFQLTLTFYRPAPRRASPQTNQNKPKSRAFNLVFLVCFSVFLCTKNPVDETLETQNSTQRPPHAMSAATSAAAVAQVETDCFRLGRHAMFRTLRDQLDTSPQGARPNAQNLIEAKDDMLFAWQAADCSVLCLNWRAAYTKAEAAEVPFQVSVYLQKT